MIVVLAALGAFISLMSGISRIRRGRKIAYYRLSRKQINGGWRTLLFAILLVGVALTTGFFAEPVTYKYFPPSLTVTRTPTITETPTITLTPTITETPSITFTPAESYTPTITLTPFMPADIEAQFTSVVTPNPEAVFSPLTFSLEARNFSAINPQTVFQNPLKKVVATYSYDKMNDGAEWTALFYRNGDLVKYETSPWEGGTGGLGQFTLELPPEEWLPGTYQLIFFVGTEWKVLGQFLVMGNPPAPTATFTPSLTQTPTLSPTITNTHRPTSTPVPTDTRWPTATK